MKHILKSILGLAIILIASQSFAEFREGQNAILVNFGFTRGGMALGLDYEHAYERTYSLGGYFRMYPDSTSPAAAGVTTAGAFIRPHFNRQSWDFYLSPGFGFISYDPGGAASSETLIGPSFATGLLYEIKPTISFGCELMGLYSWFGEEDYRGFVSEEFMAKFRFIF
ncbi:MAG: hypothetical protein KDD38_07510 [Bdellovibrionales bacterium]|nr:hypothetical protein [Bdellovibrionales bacterium]